MNKVHKKERSLHYVLLVLLATICFFYANAAWAEQVCVGAKSNCPDADIDCGVEVVEGSGFLGTFASYEYCYDSEDLEAIAATELADRRANAQAQQEKQAARRAEYEKEAAQRAAAGRAAAEKSGSIVPCQDGCTWKDLVKLANNLISFIIWIGSSVVVVMFCLAGFKIVTAGGDPGKAREGRDMMTRAVVGFVIVLLAWLMVNAILNTFGDKGELDSGTGPGLGEFIDGQ